MQLLVDALERLPVATLVHLIVAVVLGADLVVNGNLSSDALTYAGIVEGGNGLVGLGRAHVAAAKQTNIVGVPTDPDAPPSLSTPATKG